VYERSHPHSPWRSTRRSRAILAQRITRACVKNFFARARKIARDSSTSTRASDNLIGRRACAASRKGALTRNAGSSTGDRSMAKKAKKKAKKKGAKKAAKKKAKKKTARRTKAASSAGNSGMSM
jgi:hypothetical protein